MPCQGPWGGGYGGRDDRDDYLEAERKLCEARYVMLRLAELAGAKLTGELAALVAKHRKEHLAHRRGDRKHVIERIDATIERVREDMADVVRRGGNVSRKQRNHEARLLAHKRRIRAITDEQLLETYWGNEKRLSHDEVDHED